MDEPNDSIRDDHQESSPAGHGHGFYRLESNHSNASIFEDVEMAQDELFAGPVAESLPSSVSAFRNRRVRADSTTSFSFYQEEDEFEASGIPLAEDGRHPSVDDLDELPFEDEFEEQEDSADLEHTTEDNDFVLHRRTSTQSRGSVRSRLLRRDSGVSAGSGYGANRCSQKVYMANEDLYIAIAGFRTSTLGLATYIFICVITLGVGWLLFRWIPRWHVKLVGKPSPLRNCEWVVVENQWNEMAILNVESAPYGRSLSTVFGAPGKLTSYLLDEEQDPILNDLRMINYRYVRFYFHPIRDKFLLCNGWKDPLWSSVHEIRTGLDSEEKSHRDVVFGSNLIDIEQKSMFKLLVDEVFHPFYVFQIASLVLWSLDQYYFYAVAIFIMSVGSITTALIETRSTMRRLREISRFVCDVRVLRNGFWRNIPSSELVPGDVYEVSDPSLVLFPADSLLLSGDCIVNESMLTGESVPVSKTPATNETLRSLDLAASTMLPEAAKNFLFCGTKIIRTRRPQEDQDGEAAALAMVVRTGFNTTKGALVRSMLFPKPSGFKFYRDSFRYISVMGCVAILGFTASLVNFIRLDLEWHLIVTRALDLITIVVPPALPATLTIGTNFALGRLKAKQIFCISPQRVNVSGKLDLMCFDKTGTLTEEGLDILGVRIVSRANNRFGDILTDPDGLALNDGRAPVHKDDVSTRKAALYTMATCHSLRTVDGEPVGDPLDLKMFEFTGWSFEEGNLGGGNIDDEEQGNLHPSIARPPPGAKYQPLSAERASGQDVPFELGVLKSFEFVSQLRRASVIVRTFGRQSGDIYVKGAPECMREICRPETFPADYDDLLSQYTHKGYRVIGCATKHIKKLSWVKAQKMKRHQVESDLEFVGFIIFENKLKPTTAPVLKELLESNIGAVMVTGDNILTAISVARESGMLSKTAHCFVPRFLTGHARDPNASLQWESIDNRVHQLDPKTLLPLPPPPEGDASLPYDISNLRNYSVAVSGDVFRWVIDFAPPEVMRRMLVTGKVFARMSPDEKHELVEKLQSIDYSCGFCGDGANDCGALKAADVGISLSEAEASVAAPFTSRVFDIRCVPEVIREGRAALVTSFSCFKYMSLYSAIQFTSVSFLYASASNLGDFQFLFIDLALILPIAIFMSWAGPFPELCRKRPTADLVSRKVLTPLLGQIYISIVIQALVFVAVRRQPWFIPPKIEHEKSNIENSENTVLFLTSCFEYILAGVVLNAGRPFRRPALSNWPFVATIATTLCITLLMVASPPRWLSSVMQLTYISGDFKLFVVGLGLLYFGLAWTGEHWAFQPLARFIGRIKHSLFKQAKQRKQYKIIQEQMLF
ncbi:Vacuolar cation-transporting ATPase YPK9 [Madurella mycetomatis]|uniref:Cation-transporting ATPase n=1 Tax=Madurella mycetomatis TaxID=100816 RepID=A0A175WDK6_9PEZI|nr:Vacuolar cation-transporting ATPase YPK9 [Madurella mycetomatis]